MVLPPLYAAAEELYKAAAWREAIGIYQQIVAAAPREIRAWALMGLSATQAGDLDLAIHAFQRAVGLEPTAVNVHFRLGIALYQRGLMLEAEAAFRRTTELDPGHRDAQQNLAAVLIDQGRHAEAGPLFDAIVAQHHDSEMAWLGLANVHRVLSNAPAMLDCLMRAAVLNPANVATQHLLAAARGQTPQHPDWQYVEDFFDGYASRFEAHLVDHLAYSAPDILTQIVKEHYPNPTQFPRVLDLGCGTGLWGAAVRAVYPGDVLVGVDLSQKMVNAAQARGLYSTVAKAEAEEYLRKGHQTFDLIGATDVFIYVGDVAAIFELVAMRLAPGGVFAFTVEPTTDADKGYVLRTTGRYAHTPQYLTRLAARNTLRVVAQKTAPLRKSGASAEDGLYIVLAK